MDNDETETKEHEIDEFFALAVEKFGDKRIMLACPEYDEKVKANYLKHEWTEKMLQDLAQYKQVWLVPVIKKYGTDEDIYECPNCGKDLNGLFGGFTWGITNGEGYCSYCNQVSFRLYHRFYDGDKQQMFSALALISF